MKRQKNESGRPSPDGVRRRVKWSNAKRLSFLAQPGGNPTGTRGLAWADPEREASSAHMSGRYVRWSIKSPAHGQEPTTALLTQTLTRRWCNHSNWAGTAMVVEQFGLFRQW